MPNPTQRHTPKITIEMSATLKTALGADNLMFKRGCCSSQLELIKLCTVYLFKVSSAHTTPALQILHPCIPCLFLMLPCRFFPSGLTQISFIIFTTDFFCSHIHLKVRVPFVTLSRYSTSGIEF